MSQDPEEVLFGIFPTTLQISHSAIRVVDKKLITFCETGEARLFDLSVDRGEASDRSTPYPEEAAILESRLDGYLVAVNGYRTP